MLLVVHRCSAMTKSVLSAMRAHVTLQSKAGSTQAPTGVTENANQMERGLFRCELDWKLKIGDWRSGVITVKLFLVRGEEANSQHKRCAGQVDSVDKQSKQRYTGQIDSVKKFEGFQPEWCISTL